MARPFPSIQALFCAFAFVLPPVMVLAPKGVVPLVAALALAALLRCWASGTWPRLVARPLAGALGLLLLWAAVASFWSFEVWGALLLALRLTAVVAAGFWLIVCAFELGKEEQQGVVRWLLLGFALALGVMVFELALDSPLGRLLESLGFGDQTKSSRFNRGSTYLAILVWPLAAALWHRGLRAWALALPAGLILLFIPQESLSAVFSLSAALLFLGLAAAWPRIGRWMLAAAVVLGVLVVPPLMAGIDRTSLEVTDPRIHSSIHRLYIWSFTGERILERPLFGWGFNASRDMPRGDVEPFREGEKRVMSVHPHNAALQIWLELGIVGAGLALAPLLLLLSAIARLGRVDQAFALTMFVCAFAIALVSYGIWQNQWVATLFSCGLAFLLCRQGGSEPA